MCVYVRVVCVCVCVMVREHVCVCGVCVRVRECVCAVEAARQHRTAAPADLVNDGQGGIHKLLRQRLHHVRPAPRISDLQQGEGEGESL